MMKPSLDVALITLLDGDLVQQPEHLGVAYLAAELRKTGCTVEIFSTAPVNEAEVIARIIRMSPRLVGFSLTTASFARATHIGQQIREALGPATHITAGGPLVTSLGASLLRNPSWSFLDSAVRGDGEVPISNLLHALTSGGDLNAIPSLCHRSFAGVVCNSLAGPVNDLNWFSVPSRDQVRMGPQATARIASSRGCTSRCSFCNAPNAGNTLAGKVWRGRTPESVVDEMEAIYRDLRLHDFEFVDSTFEDPGGTDWAKQRIATIAQLILERKLNITFGCCVQSQNWTEKDLWLIDLLRRAGLQRVLIGVESGSADTLKRWHKKATPTDNRRAIQLFRSRSIYVNMGFIMFHPHSTRQEVMENVSFLRVAGCHNLRPFCTRMEVYPGTGTLAALRGENLLRPEYDHTLNPFAYSFVDKDIERLAYAMALLAGEEYASSGTVATPPPHLQFAFVDLALHSQLTWKMQSEAKAGRPMHRFQEFLFDYHALCDDVAAFNYHLFQTISSRVLSGKTAYEATAGLVDHAQSWYAGKIEEVSLLYSSCMDEQPPFAALNPSQYSDSMAGVQ
ncbi:MAG TPA: radical SAM protein [Candidatus Angelobacter sp.]|nr:radical SAM protein [Candidatus Angelobacter sp.]